MEARFIGKPPGGACPRVVRRDLCRIDFAALGAVFVRRRPGLSSFTVGKTDVTPRPSAGAPVDPRRPRWRAACLPRTSSRASESATTRLPRLPMRRREPRSSSGRPGLGQIVAVPWLPSLASPKITAPFGPIRVHRRNNSDHAASADVDDGQHPAARMRSPSGSSARSAERALIT